MCTDRTKGLDMIADRYQEVSALLTQIAEEIRDSPDLCTSIKNALLDNQVGIHGDLIALTNNIIRTRNVGGLLDHLVKEGGPDVVVVFGLGEEESSEPPMQGPAIPMGGPPRDPRMN